MTKTQTEQLAKNTANQNTEIYAMTVADIEALNWDARRTLAASYAKVASDSMAVDAKWLAHFNEAYINQAMSIWDNKVRQLENARRAFKKACAGLTLDQAEAKVTSLASSFGFRGARVDGHGMEILRGDRDGGHLYWRFEREDGETVNPDDATQRAFSYHLELTISTCGTTYSPARMALVHKIHSELLEAAAEIEATMSHERVQSTWGIPVAAEEQVAS